MKEEEGVAGRAKAEAANKFNEAKNMAQNVAQDAKRQTREKLDSGKHRAAKQTEKLAGAVERAAQELRDGELGPLSDYAGQLASGMKTFAENLRSMSLDQLLTESQKLARKNPGVFFIGSVGVGLAISRFLKASGERNNERRGALPEYPLATQPAVQPDVFDRRAVLPETGSPNPELPDNPSFADDLKKGI